MNALLWIELLLAATLWVAFFDSLAARLRNTTSRVCLALFGFLAPLAVFGALAATSTVLRLSRQHVGITWLGYTGSLLVVWLVTSLAITVYALRRQRSQSTIAADWPWGGLALAEVMTLVVVAITLMRIDLAVMSRASAIRSRAGAVLLALAPPVNLDAENAAALYTKAMAQLQADRDLERAFNAYDPGKPNPPATRALLASRAGILAMLRQASAMPYCRFDYDYARGIGILMPELSSIRQAQWLMELAISDELRRGDAAAALADVGVMFRMSRQVPQAPMAVAGLVRANMEVEAEKSLEKALPAATSARQLEPLDIAPGDFTDAVLPDNIAGEQALGEETISGLITESTEKAFHLPPLIGAPVRMYLLSDLESYSAYMEEVGRIDDRPWYTVNHAAPRRAIAVPLGYVGGVLRPALGMYSEDMAIAQARHESARAAVAIERYRLDRGKLPSRLADLVPTQLAAVPLDPFTGKAMNLAKKPDRWIVYSVGPDGKDDGGVEYNRRTKSGDVGFTLRLAESGPATRR